jgi:hypothetical protein
MAQNKKSLFFEKRAGFCIVPHQKKPPPNPPNPPNP